MIPKAGSGPDKRGERGKANLGSFPVKGFSPTYGALYNDGRHTDDGSKFGYGHHNHRTENGEVGKKTGGPADSAEAEGTEGTAADPADAADFPGRFDQDGSGQDYPFINLHAHSNFTFLGGAARIGELVDRAAELGQPGVALTDRDGLYGIVRFAKACERRGVRAILGVELCVEPVFPEESPQGPPQDPLAPSLEASEAPQAPPLSTAMHPYRLVLLAENREGYANLCRLVSEAHLSTPERDRPPTVNAELLRRHRTGLICLTGGRQGEVGRLVDAGREADAERALEELRRIFGTDHLFVELTHFGYEPHREVQAGQDGAPVYHKVRGDDGRLRHYAHDPGHPAARPAPHPGRGGTPGAPRDPGPRRAPRQAPPKTDNHSYSDAIGIAKHIKRKPANPADRLDLPRDHPQRLNPADYDVGFHDAGDAWKLSCGAYCDRLLGLARRCGLNAVVTTDAYYSRPEDRDLHLVLRAAGRDEPLSGYPERVPGARCLRSRKALADELTPLLSLHVENNALFNANRKPQPDASLLAETQPHQEALQERLRAGTTNAPPLLSVSPLDTPWLIAQRCQVDLELGRYHFPQVPIPAGETAYSLLAKRCFRGIERRYRPVPPRAVELLEHELAMIEQMGFAHYFLVVHDIVRWARAKGIAASGRGSAGNSLVCHLLDITASEPIGHNLLFERFLNPNRREMPDIDVDFCSARRDEVVEHIYRTFGDENVAVVANVNTASPRSAVRLVAEALGFAPLEVNTLAKNVPRHGDSAKIREYLAGGWPELQNSLLQDEKRYGPLLDLVERLDSFPLHLGTHLGGFVIADRPVTYYAPLQWAAKGVVVTQFNKDDVADLGLVKMDILGLRTHSAVMETVHLIRQRTGRRIDPYELSPEDPAGDDPAAYEIISNGGSIGLFQLESAGQRNLATRLRERTFDDIIAAIALYRPGPLEAEMITPFIDRRWGVAPVELPHSTMAEALRDTYGVILYQEQVLRVAQLVAGFSPAEADSLRRAMTRDKNREQMREIGETFVHHAVANGVPEAAAREIFRQLEGFAAYGFNKSHSVCFAVISYATAYLKAHYPAEFLCAVLNNQPMGFYTPRTVLNDARRFGLEVRPLDINLSGRGFTVEDVRPPAAGYNPFALAWTRDHNWGLTAEDLAELEAIHGDGVPLGRNEWLVVDGSVRRQEEIGEVKGAEEPGERRAKSTADGQAESAAEARAVSVRGHRPSARGGVSPGACLAPAGTPDPGGGTALRVGLSQVKQMSERALKAIEAERQQVPFESFEDFYLRTRVEYPIAENLIRLGAFDSLEPDRTELLWRLPLLHDRLESLAGARDSSRPSPLLPRRPAWSGSGPARIESGWNSS